MRYLIGLLGATVLLAAACGEAASQLSGETGDGAAAVEVGDGEGAAPGPAGNGGDSSDGEGGSAGAGMSGTEETVQVGDAGEVDVRITEEGRLELVEVRERAGWTHRVDDLERTEIELDFRHDDGRELELEIELEGGRLRVETG